MDLTNREKYIIKSLNFDISIVKELHHPVWWELVLSKDLEGENRLHACYAFLSVALLCLGIVTVQNIIDFKNGKENKPT